MRFGAKIKKWPYLSCTAPRPKPFGVQSNYASMVATMSKWPRSLSKPIPITDEAREKLPLNNEQLFQYSTKTNTQYQCSIRIKLHRYQKSLYIFFRAEHHYFH